MEIVSDSDLVKDANTRILGNLGLEWKDLENKNVLDVGAGDAKLARAAKEIGSSATIFSVDMEEGNWSTLPSDIKNRTLIASAEDLPFPDKSFDLIINNGSVFPYEIKDELRVLKSGGEIRVFPIGSLILEYRYVGNYLYKYKHLSLEKINEILAKFHQRIIEDEDGFMPRDYVDLRTTALETMTQEEKQETIETLINKYSNMVGVHLSYKINNPQDIEPQGYVFYKKP